MLLTELLSHLARRFPEGATVLCAEVTLRSHDHPSGIVETVSYEADEVEDEDGPDDGEAGEIGPWSRLRLVA